MSAVPTVIFGENHLGAMKNQRCIGLSVVSGRVITGFQCILPNLYGLATQT